MVVDKNIIFDIKTKDDLREALKEIKKIKGNIVINITSPKPTIAELEAILDRDENVPIVILPNGEIRTKNNVHENKLEENKPLTMKENLGGEYLN